VSTIRDALRKNRYGGQSKDVSFSVYVDQIFLPSSEEKQSEHPGRSITLAGIESVFP
jgi:hypothetical protein